MQYIIEDEAKLQTSTSDAQSATTKPTSEGSLRELYERIARGHALAEVEAQAQHKRTGQ